MNNPETVEINSDDIESTSLYTQSTVDSLYERQKREVSQMRASLLACDDSDIRSVRTAMNNVLVLRVMHQIARIVRFTEMLDKIEDKLYRSLDATLLAADEADPTTWAMLMKVQAQLQETMVESQKLLDPYLKNANFAFLDVIPEETEVQYDKLLYDQESRERIRQSAQAVLEVLNTSPLTGQDLPNDGDRKLKELVVVQQPEEETKEVEHLDEEEVEMIDAKELAKQAIEKIKKNG